MEVRELVRMEGGIELAVQQLLDEPVKTEPFVLFIETDAGHTRGGQALDKLRSAGRFSVRVVWIRVNCFAKWRAESLENRCLAQHVA